MNDLSLYGIRDCEIPAEIPESNPWQVEATAGFLHESGERIDGIPAFYAGDGVWKVRFSPTLPGKWTGETASREPALGGQTLGPIEVTDTPEPRVHGRLKIDPRNPQRFVWEDGTPFIYLGFECDWLFAYHEQSPDLCRKHLAAIHEYGFNAIVTNVYAHTGFCGAGPEDKKPVIPETVYGPPRVYCFGGSNDAPDHGEIDSGFFENFDRMMYLLRSHGIVAHIMIQVQNKRVNWPERGSPEDEAFWRYVVARYQAFGNVIWDVGKESFYLYKETGSHGYALGRIGAIRDLDAYGHIVTCHDPMAGSEGRRSEVDDACDLFSDQVHLADARAYNREAIKSLKQLPGKPYLNIEYGYELGVDDLKTYVARTTATWENMIRWVWGIYAAGAYGCYYYSNTSWDLIKFEPHPPGWKPHRFLTEFLRQIPFHAMRSANELVSRGMCLAQPGTAYLVFLPEGGTAELDATDIPESKPSVFNWKQSDREVDLLWMDVLTGERVNGRTRLQGYWTKIESPFAAGRACVVRLLTGETGSEL